MPRWASDFIYDVPVGGTAHGGGSHSGTLFSRRGQTSAHRAFHYLPLQTPDNLEMLHTQEVFNEN